MKDLKEILKEFGGKMIVRSSSENEDNPECSMAGMYLSIGGISDVDACRLVLLPESESLKRIRMFLI